MAGRKKKITESKTTALMYFDNLGKKQQDQGSKNWSYTGSLCHWQSQISELLGSVLKILNFWNKF